MSLSQLRNKKKQVGAVLLLLTLVLVAGSSFTLLRKLNAAALIDARQEDTAKALTAAKQALIAYAISFPEIDARTGTDPINGPGYLPCPDINKNGSAGGTCSLAGNTSIGRFPFVTLDVHEMKDASGQRLWYVLSDNYRNSAGLEPLNSETPGQLGIDMNLDGDSVDAGDLDDIVAIIIAPGEPVTGQNRDPSQMVIVDEIANYLEGDNNDLDTVFVNRAATVDPNVFNDQLITITRQELMREVETRVLGDVSTALGNYNTTHGAYPWLSSFADPKAVISNLTGTADAGSNATTLNDTDVDFVVRGINDGDIVFNITDGSVGEVDTAGVAANALTITGLSLGTENDFDTGDEYVVIPSGAALSLTGAATANGDNDTLNDNSRNLTRTGAIAGAVIENITDGSTARITSVSANSIEVDGLTGGTDNQFQFLDNYRIRSNYGRATNAGVNQTLLEDSAKDFLVMGVSTNDIVWNISDGSVGRIINVTSTSLTVDELYFGNNNQFSTNDFYVIPKFNSVTNVREGNLGIHEVGEHFKTDFSFDWTFTPNAADKTITNSTIIENYLDNYLATNSESFTESDGTCIWYEAAIADCFVYYKDFVRVSGLDDSAVTNKTWIGDSGAVFSTDGIKRGDIAQNYDDESLITTGTVDSVTGTASAGSGGLILNDIANNFLNTPISIGDTVTNTTDGSSGAISSFTATQITVASLAGGTNNVFANGDSYQVSYDSTRLYDASANFSVYERYSYVIQNNTLEGELGEWKIQGVISDIVQNDTLEAEPYVGEGTVPIRFRPGDTYAIYQPRQFVVESITGQTQVNTDNYLNAVNPDFDNGEYYRIMPAANSTTARVDSFTTGPDVLTDTSATFVTDGVEVGDIVENHDGAFGPVTAVTETTITTNLTGGATSDDFAAGSAYTVYYDYVYSREHTVHAKFRGTQATKTVTEERKRDVCLGYNADCSAVSAAVNFSQNNAGTPLVTINDYQEDETTIVGTATFTPSNLSSGTLRVSNIDFFLNETSDGLASWILNNKWHEFIYVSYSAGDAPGAAAACTVGTDCLSLNGGGAGNAENIRALVVSAGTQTAIQDRSNAAITDYYESGNSSQADDDFQKQIISNTFNDQLRVVELSP